MELKYNYLYNRHNQVVFVEEAIKDDYKISINKPLDYTYVEPYNRSDGTFVSGHFKLKSENPFAFLGISESNSESIEHKNAKLQIVYNKKYFDTIFNKWILFDEVIEEQKQDEKRPDLSCYINNKLVCLIEIYHTNKKTELDIEKLKITGVPVIELDTNGNTKHLVLPKILESNKREFTNIETEIKELEKEYSRIANELQPNRTKRAERFIEWLSERKRREFKKVLSLSGRRTDLREEVAINRDIKRVKNDIEKLDYRIGKLEFGIDETKRSIIDRRDSFNEIAKQSKIEWFRNTWMTYKPQNLIEEIKYWLQ
jgi:archaellum component FlaC